MARTKPSAALSKVLKAEQLRLRQLQLDVEFQRDVAELEAIAKRLASGPPTRILVRDNRDPEFKFDLKEFKTFAKRTTTADEEGFHELAGRFKEKWGFKPKWGDDGRVTLFIRSPVSWKNTDREIVETTRSYRHHTRGDVDALEKHYLQQWHEAQSRRGRKVPRQRRRLDAQRLRLKALDMQAKGWGLERITKALFEKYERPEKRWSPEEDPRYRDMFNKYVRPPHSLNADAAMKRADEEIRQVHRREADENRKLRERVRRLIESHPKKLQR